MSTQALEIIDRMIESRRHGDLTERTTTEYLILQEARDEIAKLSFPTSGEWPIKGFWKDKNPLYSTPIGVSDASNQ